MVCISTPILYTIVLLDIYLTDAITMIPQLHMRILAYDTSHINRNWGTCEHCDPFWRLYVNQRSGAYLDVPGGRYDLVPNHVHLIPAWVRLRCRNRRPGHHFYVHFDLIGPSGEVVRDVFDRPQCLPEQTCYTQTVEPLPCAQSESGTPDLAATMYVKSLVASAMRDLLFQLTQQQRDRLCQLAMGNHQFDALLRYIDSHLAKRLDNQDLASISHMSKSHFIRRFHDAVGQTPAAFVLEKRIAAAAGQLSFSDDTIEEIAQNTGFSDRFYFTRVFTRLMGIPPAAYRNAIR